VGEDLGKKQGRKGVAAHGREQRRGSRRWGTIILQIGEVTTVLTPIKHAHKVLGRDSIRGLVFSYVKTIRLIYLMNFWH
jgi:hypothetical protein